MLKMSNFMRRHFLSDAEAHARLVQRGHLRAAEVFVIFAGFTYRTVDAARAVASFLSPAAFEARGRERERKRLVAELGVLDEAALYDAQRRPVIVARLETLSGQDLADWIKEMRAKGQTVHLNAEGPIQASGRLRRQQPVGNFVFCTSDKNALKPDVGNRRFRIIHGERAVEKIAKEWW